MAIATILSRLSWTEPRPVLHPRETAPTPLLCSVEEPPALRPDQEPQLGVTVPAAVLELWRCARSARLFVDVRYGQWGLQLGSPNDAGVWTARFRRERPRDRVEGDLILGRFLGDSDELLVRCAPRAEDHGHVLVTNPIDRRSAWPRVARDLEELLVELERADGAKYWEP